MAQRFGIDFGTTNSVASVILYVGNTGQERVAVLTNRDDQRPHPSVIWYRGTETIVGRKAKQALGDRVTGASGDFVRSPKTLLGSPHGITAGGVTRRPADLAADIFKFLRRDALDRNFDGQDFERAIVSIPVTMRGDARRELRQAALTAGIIIDQFVHEPLAALYGHLRGSGASVDQIAALENQLLLVFDWGGGTLDLTLCRVKHGVLVQIANLGDSTIGGDQFDLRLEKLVRTRHEDAHPGVDWTRLQPTGKARLIEACEDAKIALSTRDSTTVFAVDVLAVEGDAAHVEIRLTRDDLLEATKDLVYRGLRRIEELLARADASERDIEFCLATGGTVAMPAIRDGLIGIFGPGRCRFSENAATVISEGCAWIAHDSVPLTLAKSISLLHAGDVFIPTIPGGTLLPKANQQITDQFSFYCVDPRDGFAKFLLARSRWPGDTGDMIPYGQLAVKVDPTALPLRERLHFSLKIDEDLVIEAKARSDGAGHERTMEIHDLEFGLALADENRFGHKRNGVPIAATAGDIRVKSNVTDLNDALSLVPGEILLKCFPLYQGCTELQRDEHGYYLPCCFCNRMIFEIMRDGCEACASSQPDLALQQAELRREIFAQFTAPETWINESLDPLGSPGRTDRSSTPPRDELLTRPLTTLGFSVRVMNCIQRHGLHNVGDLVQQRAEEVERWRSLGTSGFREIEAMLEGLGLSFS